MSQKLEIYDQMKRTETEHFFHNLAATFAKTTLIQFITFFRQTFQQIPNSVQYSSSYNV
jgi:hypothetical protein